MVVLLHPPAAKRSFSAIPKCYFLMLRLHGHLLAFGAAFFEVVFGMQVCRTQGPADAPTSLWLDGGLQLLRVEQPSVENGRFHHLAFQVASVDAVLQKATAYGATPVPGKGHHWFMLPNGINFELNQQ